jgi:hypothetical protein
LAVEKEDQHTIPKSYLRAWCDPSTPDGAFIWVFPRGGGKGERSSPRRTFTEQDFYTLPGAHGGRDLSIENALGAIEGAFVTVRNGGLRQGRPLSDRDSIDLCGFVAAMLTRTTRFTDHHRGQWSETLRQMEYLERAPPGVKARGSGVPSGTGRSMGIEDVRAMAEFTAQANVSQMVPVLVPLLCAMNLTIIETNSTPGFITSDAPCVWFDPFAQLMPWPYDGHGLGSSSIEIMMPLSPQQAALLTWHIESGYRTIDDATVTEVNRSVHAHCYRSFVVSRQATNAGWLERFPHFFQRGQ